MCEIFVKQDPSRYVQLTRRVRLNGQATSIRLEAVFWAIIDEIARHEKVTTGAFLSTLHTEILLHRGEPTNFASLLRCTCLIFLERNPELSARFANVSGLSHSGFGAAQVTKSRNV
jgi:predicted DNA-binding ribbon-helix-helix protein